MEFRLALSDGYDLGVDKRRVVFAYVPFGIIMNIQLDDPIEKIQLMLVSDSSSDLVPKIELFA